MKGKTSRNAASAKSSPATTSGSRACITARAVAVAGTVASVVTSPLADVLGQGGLDGLTDFRGGQFHAAKMETNRKNGKGKTGESTGRMERGGFRVRVIGRQPVATRFHRAPGRLP